MGLLFSAPCETASGQIECSHAGRCGADECLHYSCHQFWLSAYVTYAVESQNGTISDIQVFRSAEPASLSVRQCQACLKGVPGPGSILVALPFGNFGSKWHSTTGAEFYPSEILPAPILRTAPLPPCLYEKGEWGWQSDWGLGESCRRGALANPYERPHTG